jgi:hypothetical protein
MMISKTEVKAQFLLMDYVCSHDEVTEKLGIQPSHTWNKGDRVGRSLIRQKTKGWAVTSPLGTDEVVEHHAEYFANLFSSREKVFETLSGIGVEFSAAVYSYGFDRPPLHFDSGTVAFFSRVNAAIDIDLYVFDSLKTWRASRKVKPRAWRISPSTTAHKPSP